MNEAEMEIFSFLELLFHPRNVIVFRSHNYWRLFINYLSLVFVSFDEAHECYVVEGQM